MNNALKAALLSALIFPGIGHFSVKKPIQGAILAIISAVSLFLIISSLSELAAQISVQIQNTGITPSIDELASQTSSQGLTTPSLALSISWIIGIIDSFRVGLALDKKKEIETS